MSGGFFVTVDGPGGVGKSTVTTGVASLLDAGGSKVMLTTQPSQTDLGNLLRASTDEYQGHSLAHLIAGDRMHHVASTVAPAISRGEIVVCDRYVASSLVLQRMDGLSLSEIWDINQPLVRPSLSIILTAKQSEIEGRLARRGPRHSRFEEMEDSTERELRYFADAATFLREREFEVVVLDCTDLTVLQTTHEIIQEIFRVRDLKGSARA
jgi:dTMP kinase